MRRTSSFTFSSEICVICWDSPAKLNLKPCSHKVICRKCVSLLDDKKCPICRVEISEVLIIPSDNIFDTDYFQTKLNGPREDDYKVIALEAPQEHIELRFSYSKSTPATFLAMKDKKDSKEVYVLSMDSILENRRRNEEVVKKHAYQVVITGSESVRTDSLASELRRLFPLKHDLMVLQGSLWQYDQSPEKKGIEMVNSSFGVKSSAANRNIEYLVDTFCSMELYFPNSEICSVPINLRHLSIWELLYVLRKRMVDTFDVMVLCCDAHYRKSFEELLCLDELLRTRYVPGKARIWAVLNSNEMPNSNECIALSDDEVENAFYHIPANQRPNDLLFVRTRALRNFWHRELMQRIVLHARSHRKLTTAKPLARNEKQAACCCM